MVRTAKDHHHPEEEDDGEELTPGTTDASQRDGKSTGQKANSSRSKHSETEQRRRSKINERFQILRDLIPPNDQKRDKASLLLEVIEYIQFLKEKIQMYEGSYQGWSQEPTKLIPWRSNHGLGKSYSDHSQVMKDDGSGHDNDAFQPIVNIQSIAESEFSSDAAYRGSDHISEPTSVLPINMSSVPNIYSSGRSILLADNLASQPELQFRHGGSPVAECTITGNTTSNHDRTDENSLSNFSTAYSQGLLKSLTQALQTSGVDLSQANLSVQLDIVKPENSNHTLLTSDPQHAGKGSSSGRPLMHYRDCNMQDSNQAAKRLRTSES